MTDFRIRHATADDRDALGRLWQELMESHARLAPDEFTVKDDGLAVWFEWLDSNIGSADAAVLLAESGGETIGYILGKPGERPPVYQDRALGVIHEISVTAGQRRQGVGRQLTSALLDWFRERGLSRIRVSAAAPNPTSNAFWRAMGFEPLMNNMGRVLSSS
jgi:GNAT superfamily N-acetyltransferase